MSNALAIAAVTAVLKDLLNNGLINHDVAASVGVVNVSTKAPDQALNGGAEQTLLDLFLYHVTPNPGWRNVGLPTRDDHGDRLTNPPLALDLHYLLIAHGAQDFQAEILLGYAMQILHETPVLSRDSIRRALAPVSPVSGSALPPAYQALAAAELADQIEQIKLCPETLGLEDLSKLWTAFQTNFRLTTAYMASVVLIESKRSTRAALPVLKPKLYAIPVNQPAIEQVLSDAPPAGDPRITSSSTLVIKGSNLRGQVTRVRIGETLAPPPPLNVSDTQISLPLAPITTLQAGVQGVQVVHQLLMGEPDPGLPHRGFESNIAAFVLHPTIAPPTLASITSTVEDSVTYFAATATATFTPRVGKAQRVLLLLNEFNAPDDRPSRAYTFPAPTDNGIASPAQVDTATIDFAISHVLSGTYVVRVQVDGAESPLTADGAGRYAAPQLTIV
jgi:uncharacterized protein DUF4255